MALNPVDFVDNYIFPIMLKGKKLTAKQKKEIRDSWLLLAQCLFTYLQNNLTAELFIPTEHNYEVKEIGSDGSEQTIDYYSYNLPIK